MNITTTITFTERHLSDILITAFEGGIDYWAQIVKFDVPEGATPPAELDDMTEYRHGWLPLVEGCGIWIEDAENPGKKNPDAAFDRARLDRAALAKGLQLCAEHHPKVFNRIVTHGYDACDADVVVQYAVLGSVVFG